MRRGEKPLRLSFQKEVVQENPKHEDREEKKHTSYNFKVVSRHGCVQDPHSTHLTDFN